jgi:hypothetical protein
MPNASHTPSTILEIAEERATRGGFIEEGAMRLSLEAILKEARSLAVDWALSRQLGGQYVLLQGPLGVDWAKAFFALLYARAMVVPVAMSATLAELT